jgi:hypothetical protein
MYLLLHVNGIGTKYEANYGKETIAWWDGHRRNGAAQGGQFPKPARMRELGVGLVVDAGARCWSGGSGSGRGVSRDLIFWLLQVEEDLKRL